MPLVIDCPDQSAIELDALVEYLHDAKIDTTDEASMLEAAPMLRRLAANRTFLADTALTELKQRRNLRGSANTYSPQVMMLYGPKKVTQNFFVRANIWPSPRDHIFMASGAEQFFYHYPHDHSFNFLTVGYFGPGYSSNYYEYDYPGTAGYLGEEVQLRFVEHSSLDEGKVMLYRACRDVHDQIPGDSLSISLNIMENTMRASLCDQYAFDVGRGEVSALINRIPSSALLPLIAGLDQGNGADFLVETARSHPAERVRCTAMMALAGAAPDLESAMAVYQERTGSDQAMVRGWAGHQLARLEKLAAASPSALAA
jgi:hypothetical protein